MGQDRCYSEEEKLEVLRTIQAYRDRWEALEHENLESDVKAKLDRQDYDKMYKEHYDAVDNQELEKVSEEQLAASSPGDGEDPLTDNEKLMISLKAKF